MRHHLQFFRVVFVFLALLSCTAIAIAQETNGAVAGTVKDSNGGSIKGATVTFTDSDKKVVVRTVVTDDNGDFSAPALPVAYYDITVEAPSFKKHLSDRVKVNVNERRTLDVALEAGSITETVTVTSGALQVN